MGSFMVRGPLSLKVRRTGLMARASRFWLRGTNRVQPKAMCFEPSPHSLGSAEGWAEPLCSQDGVRGRFVTKTFPRERRVQRSGERLFAARRAGVPAGQARGLGQRPDERQPEHLRGLISE